MFLPSKKPGRLCSTQRRQNASFRQFRSERGPLENELENKAVYIRGAFCAFCASFAFRSSICLLQWEENQKLQPAKSQPLLLALALPQAPCLASSVVQLHSSLHQIIHQKKPSTGMSKPTRKKRPLGRKPTLKVTSPLHVAALLRPTPSLPSHQRTQEPSGLPWLCRSGRESRGFTAKGFKVSLQL